MKALDSNGDHQFSPLDSDWNEVQVWGDQNHNGLSERSELRSLNDAGMESIDLDYLEIREVDAHGNETRQRSTFRRRAEGGSKASLIVDVWFNALARH